MAEAHSAVAFSFTITHEGWALNFDREVLHLIWKSGTRSWKKRYARSMNNFKCGIYPAPLETLWLTIAIVTAIHFAGYKVPFDLVGKVAPYLAESSVVGHLAGSIIVGTLEWILAIYTMRYILKLLLMYKGWMYEERGRGKQVSRKTRLWYYLIKLFYGWHKPMLYSFQGSLPRLPLPSVKDTMRRYLRSVRPLLDDEKYARMERLANEFENGIAKKLQFYLFLKSWWATNYVSDWWEEYVYLRGRTPLVVNSNFYGIDALFIHPTQVQAARAASIIYSCLQYRRLIDRQELEPIMVQGLAPLCSWQYERLFNTTRIPGIETDKLVHLQDSNHIVVYHKGRYFKLNIYSINRILTPCEIERQIQMILDDKSEPLEGEEKLAALTAGNREDWARARKEFFSSGVNQASLDLIEKAAFVVALDDVPYEFDQADPNKLNTFARTLFHGNCHDRWFDKSFTLCIATNGRIGFNAEHSWADAAIMSHLWEYVFHLETNYPPYGEDGHTIGEPEILGKPSRLSWKMDSDCIKAIEKSDEVAQQLAKNVELIILVHDAYGKGFIKKCGVSPDAYIQMALQLAYYRDDGKFNLTYEASMTRLFREGRTETVRPCTIESCAWVKAMENPECSATERYNLLLEAAKRHQLGYQEAMCGSGIDRHLFCLYVISKYLEVDSPFLKEVLSEPWKLSTSQTPHGQTAWLDLKKHPNCISAGGGFGPVADDGYGVSYIIAGEDLIFFHISSKFSSPATSSSRFAERIRQALADMRNMFEERNRALKAASGS